MKLPALKGGGFDVRQCFAAGSRPVNFCQHPDVLFYLTRRLASPIDILAAIEFKETEMSRKPNPLLNDFLDKGLSLPKIHWETVPPGVNPADAWEAFDQKNGYCSFLTSRATRAPSFSAFCRVPASGAPTQATP